MRLFGLQAVALAASALMLPVPSATAAPLPDDAPLGELLSQLQRLHRQAEQATEAYNATAEELRAQRTESRELDGELADARAALAEGRRKAALIARDQYRGGGFVPYLGLLVSRDSQTALDHGQIIRRAAGNQAATVERLEAGTKRLDALADSGRAALDRQRTLAVQQKRRSNRVDDRLDAVEDALDQLTEEQLAALDRIEVQGAERRRRALVGSGALDDGRPGGREPSRSADRALSYALDQVGKPYRPGADGPRAFDSSGLAQRAWRRSGVRVPRTSEGQWSSLPRVPLDGLRPGDLVVYHRDASHVALYLGNGRVVEAPRTGQQVRVVPITIRPVRGAVRPGGRDPEARPCLTCPACATTPALRADDGTCETGPSR